MAGYDIYQRSDTEDNVGIGEWILENVKGSGKYRNEYDTRTHHISFKKNSNVMYVSIYDKSTLQDHTHALPECSEEDVYIVAENIIYMLYYYGVRSSKLEGIIRDDR